jgi:hypothetical protein
MTVLDPALSDTITIVRARRRRLAKLIRGAEIVGYDAARTIDLSAVAIDGLAALGPLLTGLLRRPDCAVVRGAIADPARTRGVRRLLHPDLDTGDMATLRDVPRQWLALDIDGLPRPDDIEAGNLPECARVAIAGLPAAFQGARCIVQATASHGFAPGVRLRLWYWLSRPMSGAELRHWLRAAPVDHSVFGAAQPIYTAAPIFADGARDPLPERIAMVSGTIGAVGVPPTSTLMPLRQPGVVKVTIPDSRALAGLVRSVARAAEGERNAVTFWAACRAGEMAASGLLGAETGAAVISHAAMQSGLPRAEAERTAWSGIRRGLGSVVHA